MAEKPIQEARRRLAEHAIATLTDAERKHLTRALEKIIVQMGVDKPIGEAPPED